MGIEKVPQQKNQSIRNQFKMDPLPLNAIVNCDKSDTIPHPDKFRTYISTIDTSASVNGSTSTTQNHVFYRIGRTTNSTKQLLYNMIADRSLTMPQRFKLADPLKIELAAYGKKFSNFRGEYSCCDFSAMLEYLAACLACYTISGNLSVDEMLCGNRVNIRVLNTYDIPIVATDVSAVFIPHLMAKSYSLEVFVALVCAANACGAVVATDMGYINDDTISSTAQGARLALACYEAIRVLASIMNISDAGAKCAYAITRGVHKALSVVGHTD